VAFAEIEVRVLNVSSSAGSVRVAICTAEQWLRHSWIRSARVPAQRGQVVVTVPDVPPGTYGILAHHDWNDDGKVNRNLFGRPTEGIGFSRNAPMNFGPPRFEDAAVRVVGERAVVEVTLRFEPAPPAARRLQR
jgi:uncharacterized protein (DUF2141 family)